ncbi:MAG TPA: transglutaminaseTgpA domain-containing protein [Actinomycetes bacterium]|nr:transglutaminaseTgpA domain-containing protein [Actinomycetes bacterium]
MATTDSAPGARNTDYAQALALAGLLAGASLSLSRLYVGNKWLLPTWLTMAAALGLAALLRRLGVGQLLSLAAMAAGFVVVAGILLFPHTLLVIVPTRETLSEMARAASTALIAVSEQAAPVQVTAEFVLLTCAGAWAVATAADGLAFRARQPLLALVPALGLFVFPAVVKAASPAWYTTWFLLGAAGLLLFEGRARLATWGRWVSSPRSRPGTGWRLPLTPAASTGRWLALGAGLLALTIPGLLPGYGQQPVLDFKEGAGPDTGVALNPFISLRTRLTSQQDVPMFKARTTRRERWRLMVYDRFDGTDFAPSRDPRSGLTPFQGQIAGEQDPDLPVDQVSQSIEIQELGSFWLPAVTAPVQVDAGRRVLANQTFASLTVNQRLRKGFTYTVVSQVPRVEAADLAGPVDYRTHLGIQPYLETGNLDPAVRQQAETVVEGKHADTPFKKALAIQDYLRGNFRYNLDVPALSAGGNQLRRFLTEVREGYCEQFAIAMAMMARQVGVPSRVAVGFTAGQVVDNDYVQVTTHDAHAWPELWFPKAGWVAFEPTPRADGTVPVPVYTTPSGRVPAGEAGQDSQPADPGTTQTPPPQRVRAPEPNAADDPAAGGQSGNGWLRRPVVQAGLAVLLLVALVPGVKWARNGLARRRAAHRPRDAVAESYTEVTSWARDAGIGRGRAETPAAYARRLRDDFAGDADPLVELTGLFERAEYAAAEPESDQAHRARRLARAARARLSGRLGWRRRLVAAVSPRSLFAPRPLARH